MSDLVEKLRNGEPCAEAGNNRCRVMNAASGCACAEAADEITRLTACVKELEDMINQSEAMALGYATENAAFAARVKELEDGLWGIINLGGTCGNAEYVRQADKIARAALEEKP